MEEYIEDIIEIILEDVSCDHQIDSDGAGKIYDDVAYCLKNEKEVIEKCIKAIPGKKPEVTEAWIEEKAKKLRQQTYIAEPIHGYGLDLDIAKDFIRLLMEEIHGRK